MNLIRPLRLVRLFAGLSMPLFAHGATPPTTPVPLPPLTAAPVVSVQDSMKDQFLHFVLDKAKQYSGDAEAAVSKAVDVAQREAGSLCAEYLRWQLWRNLVEYVGILVLTAGCAIILGTHLKGYGRDQKEWRIPICVFSGLGTLIAGIGIFADSNCLFDAIQIMVAPRIYILQQALHLIGK